MASLLKDIYSNDFYNNFAELLEQVVPNFDKHRFKELIFDPSWEEKELKQRMRHTSTVLASFFPTDFKQSAFLINKIIETLIKKNINDKSLEFMFLPDFIEIYGINDYETSLKLMENVTPFTSCEFAIRPFIIKYGDVIIQQMQKWSLHENHHVRRLASEGSRPRLPWAIALPTLKMNPTPILAILENLKNDSSEYVRRSVANSLNDISKDHPALLISIVKQWIGKSAETDALLKHASRTLLKQSNTELLNCFGIEDSSTIITSKITLETPIVKIGQNLEFSFSIQNSGTKPAKVRIEYAIYYLRNNGQHSKKVFKISERIVNSEEIIDINRKQSFRIITTRTFYVGKQELSLLINGKEIKIGEFELVN